MSNMRFYIDYTHLPTTTDRTWVEITQLVKPEVKINNKAMSDTFEHAINTLSLSLNYDHDIFSAIRSANQPILIKAEKNSVIKFNGFFKATGTAEGHILNYCQTMSISAEDYTAFLDVEVDNESNDEDVDDTYVAFKDYTILDHVHPEKSVVHALFSIVGLPLSLIDTSINIPITVGAITSKAGDTALSILDVLFYEYGYVVNWNEAGLFSPLTWIYSGTYTPVFSFNYSNIIGSASYDESDEEYGGVLVYWNEIGFMENKRLYTENLPYADDGTFSGYAVVSGEYYPDDASVVDFTTGKLQKVYQSYADEGSAYAASVYSSTVLTAKGNLQWSTSFAISHSDFSEILITENHTVTDKYSAGITRDITKFYNKRAQVRYYNGTTNSGLLLYYMHINADVTYRKAVRKMIIKRTSSFTKLNEYTTRFSFYSDYVKKLTGMLALMQERIGRTIISITADQEIAEGTLVQYTFPDLLSGYGIVTEREYNDATELLSYKIRGVVNG